MERTVQKYDARGAWKWNFLEVEVERSKSNHAEIFVANNSISYRTLGPPSLSLSGPSSSLMSPEPTESLICVWGSGAAEGSEVKDCFTDAAWRLAPVISRPALEHFKGWSHFWRSVGLFQLLARAAGASVFPHICTVSQLQATAATLHPPAHVQPPAPHPPTLNGIVGQSMWDSLELNLSYKLL